MKYISITKIKPDPNQPRRTFNEEKMEALEASMKDNGFRKQYPIIINGGNIIVDGERRWRAAEKVGIKEVPIEVRKDITNFERLDYQLSSEGAELEPFDKHQAWARYYSMGKEIGVSDYDLANKRGVSESVFKQAVRQYLAFEKMEKTIGPITPIPGKDTIGDTRDRLYGVARLISRIKDEDMKKVFTKKAHKEGWTRDKAEEINKAVKEKPLRRKQILEQDYSDDHEGSIRWKLRLEVAKSDVDINKTREIAKDHEKREEIYAAYDQMLKAGFEMTAAMKRFDYTVVAPQTRVKLHKALFEIIPFASDYFKDLVGHMIKEGELIESKKKLT